LFFKMLFPAIFRRMSFFIAHLPFPARE
jgi:hypothetical protein